METSIMLDFLAAFKEVLLYPVNPEYANFENNPVLIILVAIVIGYAVPGMFIKLLKVFMR